MSQVLLARTLLRKNEKGKIAFFPAASPREIIETSLTSFFLANTITSYLFVLSISGQEIPHQLRTFEELPYHAVFYVVRERPHPFSYEDGSAYYDFLVNDYLQKDTDGRMWCLETKNKKRIRVERFIPPPNSLALIWYVLDYDYDLSVT